jgi:presenilin-like A22 family membrane protease
MYFDITMPLTLFAVTLVSLLVNQKTEGKLKENLQERPMGVWDAALLVGLMSVMIYLIVFVREISYIMMVLYLFAYSTLLFTFTYLFTKSHWYVSALPPAVFILLYVVFGVLRNDPLWTYYLANIFGLIFAVLITLYLVGLFTWKTTTIFGVLITIMDIILVLVTRTMVEAAKVAVSLKLPVMVALPLFPPASGLGFSMMSLGLGDFFFAGLLGIQTFKKYGKQFAIVSAAAMTVSFFIFEVALLNYWRIPFAGTLMIICGWAPLVIWKQLTTIRKSGATGLEAPLVREQTTV